MANVALLRHAVAGRQIGRKASAFAIAVAQAVVAVGVLLKEQSHYVDYDITLSSH